MRRESIIFFLAANTMLIGCRKDISNEIGNAPAIARSCITSSLLLKVVSRTGTDSTVTIYTYDAGDRLMNEKTTGTVQGVGISSERIIIRNEFGIITKVVTKTSDQNGSDSTVRRVDHNKTTWRYTYVEDSYSYGALSKDSIVFVYDPAGRIIRSDVYVHDFSARNRFRLNAKYQYKYDPEGNMTECKSYHQNGTPNLLELDGSYVAKYDNMRNPLRLSVGEAFVLGMPECISNHNRVSLNTTNIANASNDVEFKTTYTYNSCNRPEIAIRSQSPGNIVSKVTFYY